MLLARQEVRVFAQNLAMVRRRRLLAQNARIEYPIQVMEYFVKSGYTITPVSGYEDVSLYVAKDVVHRTQALARKLRLPTLNDNDSDFQFFSTKYTQL